VFTEWKEEIAQVDLQAGVNKIKITWDTTDGPNLDKLMLSGAPCNRFTLNVTATNGGIITKSPARTNNTYFEGELITLLAQNLPALRFDNWSGDLTGSVNPATVAMNGNKTITGNFSAVPTYKLNVVVNGIGNVTLSSPGGEYPENTVVTLTANSVLGSTFTGYSGSITSTNAVSTITMNSVKNVTASFSSAYTFNFENVTGFAAASGDGFTTPTKGGQCAPDSVFINGPAEFNKLCETLYFRQQAYKNNTTVNGIKKAPLVILLRAGIYDGTQTLSTNGSKVFGNSMLDIPEQGDLTFLGESAAIFKIGVNVKRSYNLLIRNISFQDYYDDGINIGGTETHHIWIDHCTVGHPTTLPADSEHPDGGIDVKDGASYVTISWCLIRNSWKTSLVGHSDNNGATDNGRLKVTYINNHFFHTNSRNPRVRFGQVHVLNNLFENVMLYGSVASNGAQVFAENNFYLNTDWPMYADRATADFKAVYGNNSDDVYTSKTGNYPCVGLKQTGNAYDDSGLPVITAQINPAMLNPGGRSVKFDELNPAAVFEPSTSYTYTPLAADEVKVIVPIYAGADKVSFSTNCSPLPLQLLNFTATLQDGTVKKVVATWQTTDEVNTAGFTIERSLNAIDFTAVGNIAANNRSGMQIILLQI
jgi:pectate lyase